MYIHGRLHKGRQGCNLNLIKAANISNLETTWNPTTTKWKQFIFKYTFHVLCIEIKLLQLGHRQVVMTHIQTNKSSATGLCLVHTLEA